MSFPFLPGKAASAGESNATSAIPRSTSEQIARSASATMTPGLKHPLLDRTSQSNAVTASRARRATANSIWLYAGSPSPRRACTHPRATTSPVDGPRAGPGARRSRWLLRHVSFREAHGSERLALVAVDVDARPPFPPRAGRRWPSERRSARRSLFPVPSCGRERRRCRRTSRRPRSPCHPCRTSRRAPSRRP